MDALDAATLVPALLTGLLGSTHCAVMCAAPMASMTAAPRLANIPVVVEGGGAEVTHFPAHAWSQAGRVASYSVAGFVAGGFAASLGTLLAPTSVEAAGRLAAFLAQTILLATGLYLSGWTVALNWLERVAQPIWHRLQPLAGRVVPPSSPSAAFAFGALWGWVPCGLSWSMVIVALGSGSSLSGAGIMLAFGLGTLPVMLGSGTLAAWLASRARDPRWRLGAGLLVIVLAVAGMMRTATSGAGLADALRLCLPSAWRTP